MPLQDFTTFVEYDPFGHLTVSPHYAKNRLKHSEPAYLYKDFGLGAFGDFTHWVTGEFGGAGWSGHHPGTAEAYFWRLTNPAGEFVGVQYYFNADYGQKVKLVSNSDSSPYVSMGFWPPKYLTIERVNTQCTCKIYSDSTRTSLVMTLSVTLTPNSFSRAYACQYVSCASAYSYFTVITRNHDYSPLKKAETYFFLA